MSDFLSHHSFGYNMISSKILLHVFVYHYLKVQLYKMAALPTVIILCSDDATICCGTISSVSAANQPTYVRRSVEDREGCCTLVFLNQSIKTKNYDYST